MIPRQNSLQLSVFDKNSVKPNDKNDSNFCKKNRMTNKCFWERKKQIFMVSGHCETYFLCQILMIMDYLIFVGIVIRMILSIYLNHRNKFI